MLFMRSHALLLLGLTLCFSGTTASASSPDSQAEEPVLRFSLRGDRLQADITKHERVLSVQVSQPQLQAQLNASLLSFKILQLADLHYTGNPAWSCTTDADVLMESNTPCSEATTTQFVNELLDAEQPDFVVFTGDNVQTFLTRNHQAAVDAFTQGVEDRKIPYAVVLGNHDDENGFPREKVLEMVMQKNHSYAQRGPTSIAGVGNYELAVQAPIAGIWGAAGSDVFRMYFLDSGGYPNRTQYPQATSTYDWIKPTQISYYRNLSLSHSSNGTQTPLPAVMFFHIPIPEYDDASRSTRHGEKNERVSAPTAHSNLFDTMVELEEVKAVFVGHDHVNEYCYRRQGVQLCYGGGAGFGEAYGEHDFARRARVIEWSMDAQGQRVIRSWKRHFGALETKFRQETLFSENPLLSLQSSDAGGPMGSGALRLVLLLQSLLLLALGR